MYHKYVVVAIIIVVVAVALFYLYFTVENCSDEGSFILDGNNDSNDQS